MKTIRSIALAVALVMMGATSVGGCSRSAEAAPSVDGAGAQLLEFGARARHCDDVVALAKVDDSGHLVRSFNVADSQPTGDDANFTVRLTLGPTPPLDRLYSLATLSDARVAFTVDMFDTVGGPIFVDLAVAPDHVSGFYLAVFKSP